ncbi:acyl-CoA dehydrogenase family protein [Chondromyces crocatus]|uniref:Acyl-CoA dehydrogenase n=1 Tax=Chondromyces crocatus TaxID=52 RepID=A0A0K1EQP5_CHOCO|nr:acyl-CoA dehydrogenase family protein [Chondromyces crocatus]AKT42948.1 acyl-CoA dehydrogenase [Chondromyces crocatus]
MDFELSPELRALRQDVRAFVDERIIPDEAALVAEDRQRKSDTLRRLQGEARAAGLWTPHLPPSHGGRGLGIMGMCALFREMGRSPVGARVFHCDAPDQGNMDLLLGSATPAQQERWLKPLCEGEITSAFCMTEPAPGAGADPSNLQTRATRDGNGWVIEGHKWYSTGGGDAAFLIVMARTSDDPRAGATMFLVDRKAEGVEHVRDIPVMAEPLLAHREAELKFHGVRVDDDAVLAGVGEGFRLAQQRLVPARLTHCMRWLGLATRALDLCKQYIATRHSFGQVLARHQMIQKMIADSAAAIHAGNLMTLHCAWMLERGQAKEARPYSSMAKNHVANTLLKVLDDAIQMHGGLGYSDDMPFASWYRHARAARIADGPDEIHTMVVARDFLTRGLDLLV